jgi:hypothetical protein
MRPFPEALLEEHGCRLLRQGRPWREHPWQEALRLNQALWRSEQGYPLAQTAYGTLGSALDSGWALETGMNLMSETARLVARAEAETSEQDGKVIDEERLFTNLMSSQPLCFSLFAELQADLELASQVVGNMLEKAARVTRVEFEYSPGRGSREFTHDGTAADVYVEYESLGRRGLLCIEVKYHEDLVPRDWKDSYRAGYSEVAAMMGCFSPGSEPVLRRPPLEQLWRDHLLMGSILQHAGAAFDEGRFVMLFPSMNAACCDAAGLYRTQLSDNRTFAVWTLEAFVDALQARCSAAWVAAVRNRYLDFRRVHAAYRDFYFRRTAVWAATVGRELGSLQRQHAERVWFRPCSTGFTMVGLLPDKPQLGKQYTTTANVLLDFEGEFSRWCNGAAPSRVTPEKRIQSFLISDALCHNRYLRALNEASKRTPEAVELVFITDELVMPSISGDQRLDLLCLNVRDECDSLVLIELKPLRAMKELLRQTAAYAQILEQHRSSVADLASAALRRRVVLQGSIEKWIIWPAAGADRDPREAEFRAAGVRVVGYSPRAIGYEFRVGVSPRLQTA